MGKTTFKHVEAIATRLPDVEVTTSWGASSLKVRGKIFACMAINKSAEPDSLVVMMDMAQRDALVEEEPAIYYLTDHYVGYPCVLVRLSQVHPDALRDLVLSAYRFTEARARKRPSRASTTPIRRRRRS